MFHQTNACAKAAWHGKLYCTAAGGHELTLDLPICAAEARFNATMAFLSGGITIQGDDPRSWLSSERRDLAKRAMPPMEGPPHILDLFDGVGSDWSPGLFVRVVKTSWDSWWVVGHCNGTSAAVAKTIAASMLPVASGAKQLEPTELAVLDIHDGRYLGGLNDHHQMVTKSLDASLWRIWRSRPYPWVVGCDRHLSEGGWAVKDVQWHSSAPTSGTLTITMRGLTTEPTLVRILLPTPWKPLDSAFKQLRVMRVYAPLCMCVLPLGPAASGDDRTVTLAFGHTP